MARTDPAVEPEPVAPGPSRAAIDQAVLAPSLALLEQHLSYLAVEKGLRPRSLAAYRQDLTDFCNFLAERGRTLDSAGLESSLVLYQVTMHRRGLGARSVARKLSAIRGLFRFLLRERHLTTDPTVAIEAPKVGRPLPTALSLEEIERLLAAPDPATPLGIRDRAILELMYAAGLRESETIELKLDDLNPAAEFVRVIGKGGRERVVPVGGAALQAVADYLARGRGHLVTDITERTMFLNARGQPLSRMGLWKIVRQQALKAGLRPGVHPHQIRHSCATHMLQNGADIRMVQEFLGHADISTTQIYTHVDIEHLKAVHARTHPRA